MKLGLISQSICSIAAAVTLANSGCSGTNGASIQGNNTPHALAYVVVGEEHQSGGSESSAVVSADFYPNAASIPNCSTTVSGCTIAKLAVCDGKTGPLCQGDQICSFDANCAPTCQTACTATCPQGQECYFAPGNTQSCRAIQSFDGGDLILSGPGLAAGFTLFPPNYTYSGNGGNPLVPGGAIQLTTTGAAGAGFAPLQESFSATTLIQTIPSLKTLTASNVYNPAGFAVGWQPGADVVAITLTGPNATTAQCTASDSAGTFTVPAAVISAVAGLGSPSLTVSVTRERLVQQTNGKTVGTYTGTTVPPVGFVDLATSSTETYTIDTGCGTGEALCGGSCIDVTSSPVNCGSCAHICSAGDVCAEGICVPPTSGCNSPLTSCNGACVSLTSSPTNCGACGIVCPTGDSCINGACSSTNPCPIGYQECSNGCQNLATSSTNCGACGVSCGVGQVCSGGVCTSTTSCPTGYTECVNGCEDLLTSSSNCGGCGIVCSTGQVCSSGTCTSTNTCPSGYTACSDGCDDLSISSTDCGACGVSCNGATCTNGVCGTSTTSCSTCETSAESGTCATQENACINDTECSSYSTCVSDCAGSSTCVSTCKTSYPTGVTEAENLWSCICSSACASQCSTTAYCTQVP